MREHDVDTKPFPRVRMVLRTIGHLRFAFPLVLLGIGYLVPALHVPVGWPELNATWAALVGSLLLMFVWIITEVALVVYRGTPTWVLQFDDFVSLVMALVLTYYARGDGPLEWWYVIPWWGAIIDAVLSGLFGLNNAAQKPLIEQQK